MQRHFSNRGEAVSEVAAAKMTAHRMSAQSVFPNRRRRGVMPGQWQTPAPGAIHATSKAKKGEQKDSGGPGVGPPEF